MCALLTHSVGHLEGTKHRGYQHLYDGFTIKEDISWY